MSKEDFIKKKLSLMRKDQQAGFDDFVDPLQEMVEKGDVNKTVHVPKDGNWFAMSFDAVQVKENRLVISAKRIENGLISSSYDPSIKKYVVEFSGTRAAYIYGSYKSRHPIYGWSYIHWDVRSYANHPANSTVRVYVQDFRARDEIRKLINAMEGYYGTSNIYNSYINDNLLRFQAGIGKKKSPSQIEKEWSQGLMEGLGYNYVEAFDEGHPRGHWRDVKVHWCKKKQDFGGGHV